MANNLKPCHVCGATRGLYVLEDHKDFDWYVFCDNCKTSVHNENAQTKKEAIKVWNTRYENKAEQSCGWCNKYDEVLCDDWGNCFKWCPICGRNLGNGY